jgi:hypothetical protein
MCIVKIIQSYLKLNPPLLGFYHDLWDREKQFKKVVALA